MNETVRAVKATTDEGPEFEPLELLTRLEAQARQPTPAVLPDKLAWSDIRQEPDLFQARGGQLYEPHLSDLASAIGREGMLDPVEVIQIGPQAVLIEGHHRMEAYRRAGITEGIPVVYFTGTVEGAVAESGRANSRAKLPMPLRERNDYAWKLVKLGRHSIKQTATAANISERQVAIMRKVAKALGAGAFDHERWMAALQASKGIAPMTWEPDEIEARKEAQAQEYAERLSKAFYNKLTNNPEIAARALALHFGDKLGEVVRELEGYIGQRDDDEVDDF
ncbi:ParB/Srx family N-terminal domain-containing protein [Bosea sp. RAC05]|uniref:ParB/Srx family N-terminal domain-containing protein n=1 Tax=Bosea sp. RAC05 TaxID=1842539 RepID=UPI00083E5DA6|nr:ParB/Srx family N-terminal domain-containing protein [Bosea sp. RAC05]AOG03975.1 parB-like nuclease domain protein [Bosea sp. RAC05]